MNIKEFYNTYEFCPICNEPNEMHLSCRIANSASIHFKLEKQNDNIKIVGSYFCQDININEKLDRIKSKNNTETEIYALCLYAKHYDRIIHEQQHIFDVKTQDMYINNNILESFEFNLFDEELRLFYYSSNIQTDTYYFHTNYRTNKSLMRTEKEGNNQETEIPLININNPKILQQIQKLMLLL